MPGKRFMSVLLAALLLVLGGVVVRAEQGEVEYKVKAAFLLNFARFAAWPEIVAPEPRFALCVLGDDPFGPALAGIESKEIGGKTILLRHLASAADGIDQCRLLFVGKSEQGNLARILSTIAGQPILTVSDIEGFAKAGGVFEFKDRDGRLSFIINNTKAKASGMHISASLLNLAVEVL